MIVVPGSWKSLEELEECVTLDELMDILLKHRELRHADRKFEASLHNKELEDSKPSDDPFERARRNAEARLKSEAQNELAENSTEGYSADNDNALVALGISVTKE